MNLNPEAGSWLVDPCAGDGFDVGDVNSRGVIEEATEDGAEVWLCQVSLFDRWVTQAPRDDSSRVIRSSGSLRGLYDGMAYGIEGFRHGREVHAL